MQPERRAREPAWHREKSAKGAGVPAASKGYPLRHKEAPGAGSWKAVLRAKSKGESFLGATTVRAQCPAALEEREWRGRVGARRRAWNRLSAGGADARALRWTTLKERRRP